MTKNAAVKPAPFQEPIVLKARCEKKLPKNFPNPKTEKIQTDKINTASPKKNEKANFSKEAKSPKNKPTMSANSAKAKISKKRAEDTPPPQKACGKPATKAETSHERTSAAKIHKTQW